MKAVILAGGLGARLKPFTEVIPKPLLPIGESSVLEIQISTLKRHGCKEIFIATNYMAEYVQAFLGDGNKYGVKLSFSREEQPLGTCGPVLLLKNELKESYILMNGDILTTLDFNAVYQFALESDADLTVVTREIVAPFNFGKVISKGDYIVDVHEKPDFKLEILAGVYVLKPIVFESIPPDTYYGIDSLIKDMLSSGRKVARFLMKDYWLDIGQIGDYEQARQAYRDHFSHLRDG